jgi:hypothetical protein
MAKSRSDNSQVADSIPFDIEGSDFDSSVETVGDALRAINISPTLSSNISLYATTASSDVVGYNKLVTSLEDPDYDTVAVDVSTGIISSDGQLVGQLISEPGLIIGNPGIIDISTIGNIRKVSGSKFAEFYYEVYKRDSGGVETLIANSSPTVPVESTSYEQFFEFALLNNGIFTETDRLVIKYYANLSDTGNDPVYEFQFGGSNPVRTLLPVPVSVIPSQTAEETPTDVANFNRFLTSSETDVQKALDRVDDLAVSKDGESAMNGPLQWSQALSNGMNTEVFSSNIDADDVTLTSQFDSNPVKSVQITSRYISHTDGANPAVPTADSHLVNKKYVDDEIDAVKFTDLADTDTDYVSKARFIPTVNDSETGLNLVERKNLFITEELIDNPSFEDWSIANDMPDLWSYGGTGSAATNVERETTITFNGGTAFRLKNLTTTYSSRNFTSDVYQVPATGELLTKVYAYLPTTLTPPQDVHFRMSVSFYDASMNFISTITNMPQEFINYETWINFSKTVTIPSGAVFAETTIEANRSGSAVTNIIFDFASTVVSYISVPDNVSELDDVQIVNPLNNQVLIYDDTGSVWRNQTQTHEIADVNGLQAALDDKIETSEKGAANGVAPLNASSKIDSTYLPSYVDDVLEYADLASFPATGETGKIYVTLDANKTYRWSGTAYVELTDDNAIWGNISGTLSNQTDLQNALNAKEDSIDSSTFNRFLSTSDDTVQKALDKVDDLAVSKNGESAMEGGLTWTNEIPNLYTNIIEVRKNVITLDREFPPGSGLGTRLIEMAPDGIRFLNGSSPATPQYPETLVPKQYVDDIAATKENTSNKNSANGYAGLDSNSQISPSALPHKVLAGPGVILQFSGTTFQQSGYSPGVGVNSTPADFGFFPVQNASFVFNPFAVLGSNKNYRIYAIRRQDGALFDGVHCMIRKVENGVESGISGLLDWGAGVNQYASATSDVLNSGTGDSFMWFRCYFAAYDGANQATLQDLSLWIIAE